MPGNAISGSETSSGHPPPGGVLGCAWCGAPLPERTPGHGRTFCDVCGAATTDPWPTAAELDRAYEHYRPDRGRFSGLGDALLRRTRGRLARRVDRIAPPGPVLDVGAGDGSLLDALTARGREATGLERDSRRDDVRAGEVGDIEDGQAAVVFWHSLEHLRAPAAALEQAVGILRPGGVLLVAVPNAASLQAETFGDRWFHLDLPRHLVHLPASALVERIRALGLEVTRVSHWRGGQAVFGWLHGLVGRLPGRPDLYDAIRRPEARSAPVSGGRRALTLAAGVLLAPWAALAAAIEIAFRRGGTVYVEARRG